MIVVVKRNQNPVEHYAVHEDNIADYPVADWMHNPQSFADLKVAGVPVRYMKATAATVVEMTQAEKDQLDEIPLDVVKKNRFIEIDEKTTVLIEHGFGYDDKTFSLSRQAQSNMLGVKAAIADHRAAGTLAAFEAAFFPLKFNTLDDLDSVALAKVVDFLAFYDTAMGTVRVYLDGGTSLKAAIRAAVDKAGVDAVVDER